MINKQKIFICCTEQSGENICFNILKRISKKNYIIDGVSGKESEKFLKNKFFDISDFKSIGFFEILLSLNKYIKMIHKLSDVVIEKKYDLVICTGVWQHIESPDILIKRISSVVKNNGYVCFQYSNLDTIHGKILKYFLSDNYTIRLEFELPTTRPRKWRIRNATVFRSERWSGEVGDITVQLLESTSNTFTTSSPKVPLKLNSVNIIFYFQNGNSPRTFNLTSILGANKCGLRNNGKKLLIEVDGNQITSAFEQTGQNYDDVAYSVFSIDLESSPSFNLRSDRFYAFQAIGDYNNEGDQTDRNKFNPTKTQYDSSGVPLTNPPTSQATITISGDKTFTGRVEMLSK